MYKLLESTLKKKFITSKIIMTDYNEEIFKALKINCQDLSSSDRNFVLLIDKIPLIDLLEKCRINMTASNFAKNFRNKKCKSKTQK